MCSDSLFIMSHNQDQDVEERLFFDRRKRNDLNEVFWCHMGRYAYAYDIARAQSQAAGRPLRVLDAACGTGYGTSFLSRGGHNCTGVDLDPEAIEFCRRVYGRPGCRFEQGTVLELPFGDKTFDLVVSFETIEHLSQEQQKTFIAEIERVLKPGGQVVLSAPVQPGGMHSPSHNPFHQYEPDPIELIELMQQHFAQVETFGQLIITEGTSPQNALPTTAATSTASTSSPPLSPSAALRQGRSIVRQATNLLFERHYIMRPWLLKGVTVALYGGYQIKPLDWRHQSATFIVLDAQARDAT